MIHLAHQGTIACGLSLDSPLPESLNAVTAQDADQVTCPDCKATTLHKTLMGHPNPRGAGRKPEGHSVTSTKVSVFDCDREAWGRIKNKTAYIRRLVHEDLNR